MDSSTRSTYLGFLRDARELAQKDSENFEALIQAFERIGAMENRRIGLGFGRCRDKLLNIAKSSPLACELPRKSPHLHIDACSLFELIRIQRNDAMHQGIIARNLVRHSVEFSLIIEHALTKNMNTAAELMVRGICYAELNQPISYIRQKMLVNAFSYMPLVEKDVALKMLSDTALVQWLRPMDWEEQARALARTLGDVLRDNPKLQLEAAVVLSAETQVGELVLELKHAPILLHNPQDKTEIVGLISAFDLL